MAADVAAADRGMIVLPVIGWREWVELPELETKVKAKIDTGARTSAIHAFDVEEYVSRGTPMVAFNIHPVQRDNHSSIATEAEVVDRRDIRDSGGKVERRAVVLFDVGLHDARWTIEVTLTRRDQMGFRMLLGRSAVKDRFLVDPGASFLCGRPRRRKRRRA